MQKLKPLSFITTASLVFIAQTLLYQAPLLAGIYKWTDENGQVHYGAQPGNPDAEKVTIRTNETTKPRTINTAEEAEKDGAQPPEKIQSEILVEEKMPEKDKRRLCKQAKNDIFSINSRGRVREINDQGEYVYMSEEQRQKRLSTAKKRKKKYCR